jgi:alkylation response protein AidB-like acyl-CoA dehydrogenase
MTNPYLEAARGLRARIDANAVAAGNEFVPPDTIDAMQSEGLFGVMTPKAVGGAELPIADVLDVYTELARADGSAGWCLMAAASDVAYFGAYCPDAFVDRLFADGIPLCAGQFAPNGGAVRDAGGYRITGNYSFGSGIHYANWVGSGFIVPPESGSEAPAEYRFALVPKEEVELRGNWNVLGLQSTASLDYQMDAVYAPAEATFLFAAPTRYRGGPIYELGVISLTAIGHAGFAMGVTRRALDELSSVARTKVRMGASDFLKDNERFLHALAVLESRFRAACAWVYDAFDQMERAAVETEKFDAKTSVQVRQATVFITQVGADICREAYLLAGTTALRDGALQRCFRDIHAGSQHFFASPASTLDFGRLLMEEAAESAIDR